MTDIKQHYLIPCMIFCDTEECIVSTVLGSCISVCLHDPVRHAGGINHYMLPLWNGHGLETPKYGNIAISRLVSQMQDLGSRIENLKAKIFGGAKVLNAKSEAETYCIGARNIEVAKHTLHDLGIPIIAASVGDTFGRKIIFNTAQGNVMMKRVKRITDDK